MNLIPFNYHGFQTSESIWGQVGGAAQRLRFTRKGWGEMFGAKNSQTYLDILKHRHPELPEGIPFTVKGMTGQGYSVIILDIYEGFQYATYSDLPRAMEFVRRFPDFLTAVLTGQITPPPADIATLAYMHKWDREAAAERKRLAYIKGKTVNTLRRYEARIREEKPITKPRPKGIEAVHKHNREKIEKVKQLISQGHKPSEIVKYIEAADSSVYRWIKTIKTTSIITVN